MNQNFEIDTELDDLAAEAGGYVELSEPPKDIRLGAAIKHRIKIGKPFIEWTDEDWAPFIIKSDKDSTK